MAELTDLTVKIRAEGDSKKGPKNENYDPGKPSQTGFVLFTSIPAHPLWEKGSVVELDGLRPNI